MRPFLAAGDGLSSYSLEEFSSDSSSNSSSGGPVPVVMTGMVIPSEMVGDGWPLLWLLLFLFLTLLLIGVLLQTLTGTPVVDGFGTEFDC